MEPKRLEEQELLKKKIAEPVGKKPKKHPSKENDDNEEGPN